MSNLAKITANFSKKTNMQPINEILQTMQNIAVIGFSPDPQKDSNMVGKFLIDKGFCVYPVYPKQGEIYSHKIYQNLSEINEPIDTVVMFRKGEFAKVLIDEVIKKGISNFWLQLGITNENVKKIAQKNGINFVQNACIMVEYKAKFEWKKGK